MLSGFSGFTLEVKEFNNSYVFCKSVKKGNDVIRLFQQRDKQVKYKKIIDNDLVLSSRFFVPDVVSSGHNGFCMEYVYGRHLLDVIHECNISVLSHIMDQLFYWVEWCIGHSGSVVFTPRFFEGKLDTIYDVDDLKSSFSVLLDKITGIRIPVGYCHGDLTLSNLLYLENGLVGLVDWHDVFFESPLQDVGKLFQELSLHWSVMMNGENCVKFDTAYSFLFKKYSRWVDTLDVDPVVVRVFDFMTIFRLFAYTDDKKIRGIIYDKCLEVLDI